MPDTIKSNYGGNTIVGTDGKEPVYNKNAAGRVWMRHDIFVGREGESKFVPKIKDLVYDVDTNQWFKVVGVDSTTWLSELELLADKPEIHLANEGDRIINTTRRCRNETYRCFIDKSVMPYTLQIDSRFKVYGTMCHHAQITRGSFIDSNEDVVSMVFDHRNQLLSQNIDLELAAMDKHINYAVKYVPVCHTTFDLMDGELVCCKIYNDVGSFIGSQDLVVVNTSAMRQTDTPKKLITDIRLESIWLSNSDPTLIKYPLNVPVRGLNLFGVVEYSDGSSKRLPVDNTRFAAWGLKDYTATVPAYQSEFTLTYYLDENESAVGIREGVHINQSIYGERFITKTYRNEVVDADGAYAVKLYGYPVWEDNIVGYRMDWYLANLDRSFIRYVTPHVRYDSNRPPFVGLEYGINQRFQVSINLREASLTSKDYIHTQVVDVNLQRPASDKSDYLWRVGFEINQNPYFGEDNFARVKNENQNYKLLDISLGETKQDKWLDRTYRRSKPVYDANHEASAPEPNIFQIVERNGSTILGEFKIAEWNQQLRIHHTMKSTDNIMVKFIRRTNDTDLMLSIIAIPAKFVDSL